MKKNFITGAMSGLLVGALIFGGTSVFAGSSNPFAKSKITGVFTVFSSKGTKIADAPVIDGSTYVPVRAISDAAGISLKVEGKKIVLESSQVIGEGDALDAASLALLNESIKLQNEVKTYQTNIIAENEAIKVLESKIAEEKAAADKVPGRLDALQTNLAKSQAYVDELQAKITAAEAEIAQLQAKIDASKK